MIARFGKDRRVLVFTQSLHLRDNYPLIKKPFWSVIRVRRRAKIRPETARISEMDTRLSVC